MTYTLKTRTTEDDWKTVEAENPLSKRIGTAQRRVQQVLDGYVRACYLSGGAGLGKTQTINAACAGKTVIRAIPRDYHDLLFWFEQSRGKIPLIFEECDHLFRSERCLNLLKMATDPNGPKVIRIRVPPKKGEVSTDKTIPLTAPLVFALNGDLNNYSHWPSACIAHILALASREHPITIDGDRAERWEYTISLAVLHNLLRKTEDRKAFIPLAVQNEAIAWFTENLWRLDEVSPRRLKKIAQTMMLHHSARYRYGMQGLQDDLDQFLVSSTLTGLMHPPVPTIFVTPYESFKGQPGTEPSRETSMKSVSPKDTSETTPQNQHSDQTAEDLSDWSNEDLADLADEALTELLRRNPIAKLLRWEADKATITVQAAHGGADFKMLQRGPDPQVTAEQRALNALSHENW
ncbi:hypothetical protein [Microvirga alba]|uniref:Uncharacterized protein n=1 Tax=Microvirga alba TaxID=2791025 RepID=A0A931BRZ7_9HYPH|nr:hypothetical protein [Microvirga alba]MBF9234624.1 hypothetical protein [Microvirga alba]